MKTNLKIKNGILPVVPILLILSLLAGCKKENEIPIVPTEKDAVPRYVGIFDVQSECGESKDAAYYSMVIKKDMNTDNAVLISNFFGIPDITLKATVSGLNLTIPTQTVASGTNSFKFVGSGTIDEASKATLTIDYDFSLPPIMSTIKCKMKAKKN